MIAMRGLEMPAKSKKQQALMAIAEHAPEKLKGKNKGVLKMSKEQLHEFAATKTKNLPEEAHPWRKEWDHKK